jgi:hypothetical protein
VGSSVLLLVVAALLALLVLLANLDANFIRSRVIRWVEDTAGVSLEYDTLSVSLAGELRGSGLRLRNNVPDAEVAPFAVELGGIRADWSPLELLRGEAVLSSLELDSLQLSVVRAPDGSLSLSRLFPKKPADAATAPSGPRTPLSQLTRAWTGPAAGLKSLSVRRLGLLWVDRTQQPPVRWSVQNLALRGHFLAAGESMRGTLETFVADGRPATVSRQQADAVETAELRVGLELELRPDGSAAATFSLGLAQDAFGVPGGEGLAFELRSKPEGAGVGLELVWLRGLWGAVQASGAARVPDDENASAELLEATIGAQRDKLPKVLAALLPPCTPAGGSIVCAAKSVAESKLPGVQCTLDMPEVACAAAGVYAQDVRAIAHTTPEAGHGVGVKLDARAATVRMAETELGGIGLRVEAHAADWRRVAEMHGERFELSVKAESLSSAAAEAEGVSLDATATLQETWAGRLALSARAAAGRGHAWLAEGPELTVVAAPFDPALRALPSLRVEGSAALVEANSKVGRVVANEAALELALSGDRLASGLAGLLVLDAKRLRLRGTSVEDGHAEVKLTEGSVRWDEFWASQANLELGLRATRLLAGPVSASVVVGRPALTASAAYLGEMPRRVAVGASMDAATLTRDGERWLDLAQTQADAVAEPSWEGRALEAASGTLSVRGNAMGADLRASMGAGGELRAEGSVEAGSLGFAAGALGALSGVKADWGATGIRVRGNARTGRYGALPVAGDARIELTGFAGAAGELRGGAERAEVWLEGSVGRGQVDAATEVTLVGLNAGPGRRLGDWRGAASMRKEGGSTDATASLAGGLGDSAVEVQAELHHHTSRGAVSGHARISVPRLGELAAWVPANVRRSAELDWPALGVALTGKVDALGARPPWRTLTGRGEVGLSLSALAGRAGAITAWSAPRAALSATLLADGGAVVAELHADAPEVAAEWAKAPVSLRGAKAHATVRTGPDPTTGAADVVLWASADEAAHAFTPGYPTRDIRVDAAGSLAEGQWLQLSQLALHNAGGGTSVTLVRALEPLRLRLGGGDPVQRDPTVPGRRSVDALVRVDQDLSALEPVGGSPSGKGQLSATTRLTSGEPGSYRVEAELQASDVDLSWPRIGLELRGANGLIPVVQDVELGPDGALRALSGPTRSAFARARFGDVHPFLDRDNFFTATSVQWRELELAPLAGNPRVEWEVAALDQVEAGLRGGIVAGQLEVELRPDGPVVTLRGTATGIRPLDSDDVLDANAAFVLKPARLDAEGRAHIVRVSRTHLEELLDAIDPYRRDPGVGRIRSALALGYPRAVRLRMQRGFISLQAELGGLGELVKIEEVRGVPAGPLLGRALGDLLEQR